MDAMQSQPDLITLEEYEALPEGERVEVFDGLIYDMASPSQIHQSLLLELAMLIYAHIKQGKKGCKVFPAPFDVKLSDDPLVIVQPDLLVVCDQDKLDEKRCNGAPDFIIEIVSPGHPDADYIRKLYYYKTYGVREYWIVDPRAGNVIVYHLEQENFSLETYTFSDKVQSHIFDDLCIDFAGIDLT